MNLGKTYPTIRKPYIGNSLSLSPATTTKPPSQHRQFTNGITNGNRFRFGNITEYLEIHFHLAVCNQS